MREIVPLRDKEDQVVYKVICCTLAKRVPLRDKEDREVYKVICCTLAKKEYLQEIKRIDQSTQSKYCT